MLRFRNIVLVSAAALGMLFASAVSYGATIHLETRGAVWPFPPDEEYVTKDTMASGETSVSAHSGRSHSRLVDGYIQASEFNSNASADVTKGELKTSLITSFEGYFARNGLAAAAIAKITETFVATGSGTVTAYLALDGLYSFASKPVPFPNTGEVLPEQNVSFAISSFLSLSNGVTGGGGNTEDPANDCASAGGCTSASGTISELLTASVAVSNGQTVSLNAQLQTLLIAAEGYIDLGNTALLFLTTSAGLTLIPSDQRFLSDPTFNASPVPLPAALPLLIGGLAGLGFLKRRGRHQTAA